MSRHYSCARCRAGSTGRLAVSMTVQEALIAIGKPGLAGSHSLPHTYQLGHIIVGDEAPPAGAHVSHIVHTHESHTCMLRAGELHGRPSHRALCCTPHGTAAASSNATPAAILSHMYLPSIHHQHPAVTCHPLTCSLTHVHPRSSTHHPVDLIGSWLTLKVTWYWAPLAPLRGSPLLSTKAVR
jgi:hypothetical protein